MERNLKLIKYYIAFYQPIFLGPIITLIFLDRGLSFLEIFSLNSIMTICIFIFEVPTGAVADRFGYKYSLTLGSLFATLSIIVMLFSQNFYHFAISEVLFSLGMALISGADSGIVYDTLIALNRENEYKSYYGNARQYVFYAAGVGSLLSSFIYVINKPLPLIISAVTMFSTAIVAMFLKEPKVHSNELKQNGYFKNIYETGKYVLSHKKIRVIIIFSSILFMFYRPILTLYQPYFEATKIPIVLYGVIFLGFNIIAGITSKNVERFIKLTRNKSLITLNILFMSSLLLLGLINSWIGVFAIGLQQIVRGLYQPVLTKYIHKSTPSDKRATTISFWSLITNLSAAVFAIVMGLIKDNNDIFNTHLILFGLLFISTILLNRYLNNNFGKSKMS